MVVSQILRSAFVSVLAGAAVGVPVLYMDGHAPSLVSMGEEDGRAASLWAGRLVFMVDAVTLGWVIIAVFWTKFLSSVRNFSLGLVRRFRARRECEQAADDNRKLDLAEAFLLKLTKDDGHQRNRSSGSIASTLIQSASAIYGFASSHMERALGVASADVIDEMLATTRLTGWRKNEIEILDKFVIRGLEERRKNQERIESTERAEAAMAALLESD